jgi:hypothetical protein
MRISEDRYNRDRQRMDVAVRFLENEARTHTIRVWTGLSDDRIRKLYRSYVADAAHRPLVRHRGRSPHQAGHFMRTARLRHEAALLASVGLLLGLLHLEAGQVLRRLLPDIRRAELLCETYTAYCALVQAPVISFEHAVLLVTALLRNEELGCGHCHSCRALVIVDRLSLRAAVCVACASPDALPDTSH